ncbi:MAG: Gfo/Idh/MocA family oxidoreductase [Victivallales bacterium]
MSKKLKFAIIGTGGRGINAFGKALAENDGVEIVAFCDPNSVRMKAAAKSINVSPNMYESVEQMLENEQLDACVITSPDCCHAENAVAVLNKGINALIDKPLATTSAGCRRIIEAAEKSNSIAMIGFNLRHTAVLKRLKQIVSDGILGRVFMIENREFYDGGRTYMARWNRKYEISGGLWVHKGSHDFDIFNWLLDFPKPLKVSAFAGVNVLNPDNLPFKLENGVKPGPTCTECPYKKKCPDVHEAVAAAGWNDEAAAMDGYKKDLCIYLSDKDTHDNGFAIVEYENGAKAMHMECFVTPISDRRYTIIGTKGQAEVSLHERTILIRPRWSKETISYDIPEEEGGHGGADPHLLESFINAVKGVETNTSTTEHGLLSTVIGEAAEISRREERTVFIKELLG